jgi:hypothetical protein
MGIERNLVLVHTFGYQDVEDFQAIARAVEELAADMKCSLPQTTFLPRSLAAAPAGDRH